MTLVSLAVAAAVVAGAPLRDIGDLDAWAFWLTEAGSAREAAGELLRGPAGSVTLGLVNRPVAGDVVVSVDGREVASFDHWKVDLMVSTGETISVRVARDGEPVRVRLIASRGVRTPALGSEWSLVAGEKMLGSVIESGDDERRGEH